MNLSWQVKEVDAFCQYISIVEWAAKVFIELEADWLTVLDEARTKSPGQDNQFNPISTGLFYLVVALGV